MPKNLDFKAFILSEQISRDYFELLRTNVAKEITDKFGLRLREIRVLMCLRLSPENYMSATDVSVFLRLDRATVTRSSILLIGKKFIRTTPNLEDSRVKNLYLTDTGVEVADLSNKLFEEAIEQVELFGELGDSVLEKDEAINFMKKIEMRTRTISQTAKRLSKLRKQ